MTNVYIQKEVTVQQKKLGARIEIQEDWIISGMRELASIELDPSSKNYSAQLRARKNGLDMLSRVKAMYKDTVTHTGGILVEKVDVKDLTDAQLIELRKLRKGVDGNG